MDATTVWGEIQGREITFPMEVTDMNAATLLFSVPSAAAAALVPGHGFEVVETAPGTAQFIVAACDYVANPWGDYNELNLCFLVRPVGTGDEAIASLRFPLPFARVTPWVVLVFLLLVVVLMCFSPNYVVAAIAGPVWIVILLLGYAATARHAR